MKLFSGQRAFVVQRLSALVLLACVAAAALRLAFGPPTTFAQWQAWRAQPLGALALLFGTGALMLHAWVGIRDVLLDYAHHFALRLIMLATAALGLALLAAWTTFIVLNHAL
jgi:succinate dehydrogenase / fumarate reductase membrane anchor subunit